MTRMKVKECIDLGLWNEYCKLSNTDPYAINKGLLCYNDYIEVTDEFKSIIRDNANRYLLQE